jgi:hypothetical protein
VSSYYYYKCLDRRREESADALSVCVSGYEEKRERRRAERLAMPSVRV